MARELDTDRAYFFRLDGNHEDLTKQGESPLRDLSGKVSNVVVPVSELADPEYMFLGVLQPTAQSHRPRHILGRFTKDFIFDTSRIVGTSDYNFCGDVASYLKDRGQILGHMPIHLAYGVMEDASKLIEANKSITFFEDKFTKTPGGIYRFK